MVGKIEDIALFDMDGTLCDYDSGLFKALEKIRSPDEPVFNPPLRDGTPDYIENRRNLISRSEEWWENLPRLKLGWDLLEVAKELEYNIMILTQGPKSNPWAWSGKKKWIDKNLGENFDITITRDKGLVYGKILVDDYPKYIDRWLTWRKRGIVIMPANESNKDYINSQVIRYDGTNLDDIYGVMEKAKERKPFEEISL